jgi:uracil-DNA glycosylase family protein
MARSDTLEQAPLFDADESQGSPEEQLAAVARAARECRACPLWEIGTQTVFGAGPATARLMFIGEAPGEQEDKQGVPFVGPAGRLFDEALQQAGIDRSQVYITNVVKHRPWVLRNGRKKNRPPKQSEINACRPWLQQQLAIIKPQIIVCVGAQAAKEILGKTFKLTQQRGEWHEGPGGTQVLATIHPAYVLIQPEESYDRLKETLFADIQLVGERYRALQAPAEVERAG